MTDLEHAKQLLDSGSYTCVLCKGTCTYTSTASGIAPMVDFMENGYNLKGFSAADKIVGKAAAMLFVLAGVTALHAHVLSQSAAAVLSAHHIPFSYDTMTEQIINRKGTGLCPMEQAVCGITDLQAAFTAIKAKREALRKEIQA